MRPLGTVVLACAVALACAPGARALCPEPPDRVCAALASYDLVLEGTVRSERAVKGIDGFVDGYEYHVKVDEVFRGPKAPAIDVFSESVAERLELTPGRTYVLFTNRDGARGWVVTSCSLSGSLPESQGVVDEIRRVLASDESYIAGRIVKRSSSKGVPGVEVVARGDDGRTIEGTSGRDGWFRLDVPPGAYQVNVDAPDTIPFTLSYDDPTALFVPKGRCALVQFVAERE